MYPLSRWHQSYLLRHILINTYSQGNHTYIKQGINNGLLYSSIGSLNRNTQLRIGRTYPKSMLEGTRHTSIQSEAHRLGKSRSRIILSFWALSSLLPQILIQILKSMLSHVFKELMGFNMPHMSTSPIFPILRIKKTCENVALWFFHKGRRRALLTNARNTPWKHHVIT